MTCSCDFGTGLRVCHCANCHETFTTVNAFDLHQVLVADHEDKVICLNPATLMREDGSPVYVRLGDAWGRYSRSYVLRNTP